MEGSQRMCFWEAGGGGHTEHRSSPVWKEKAVLSRTMVAAVSQNCTSTLAFVLTVFKGLTRMCSLMLGTPLLTPSVGAGVIRRDYNVSSIAP